MPPNTYPVNEIKQRKLLVVPVSFETGEQWSSAVKLPALPYRAKIVAVSSVATKAIAASDNGSILVKKGSTTYATVTFTASDAIGTERAASTPIDTAFETTDQLSLFATKTTAGGKALLYITLEVLPSHSS